MGKISVAIIGLGRLGSSVGLALKRYNSRSDAKHDFEVIGVEDRAAVAKDAEKIGAVSKSVRNLYDGVRNRDIVVLALPYAEVRRTYQAIGQDIRAGGVVLDMSPVKMPSLGWAKEFLSKEVHMVGVTPIINPKYLFNGLDEANDAHEDFFDNGNMMLMPSPSCIREAVELASDFSALLGGKPHFMDPAEHDSLFAATSSLPAVLGVIAFYNLARNPGWDDIQRLTNPDFGRLTHHLYDTHPDDLRDIWLHNQESLLRYTDGMIESLQSFRDVLAAKDRSALEALLVESADGYSGWINRRHNNKWDDRSNPSAPGAGETIMSSLMGGFLSNRISGKGNRDED